MKIYFIEDPQKIILRASISFEQRQSGCELISFLWGMLLPKPSRGLLRRGRSHCPHVTRRRKSVQSRRELVGEYNRDSLL
jgi:hypothetical protein